MRVGLSQCVLLFADFPKPGILFWDVTTIMLNPTAFQAVIDLFVERYRGQKVDVVAGFEARGLIFGAPLALALGAAFVPLRKPGKLPGAPWDAQGGGWGEPGGGARAGSAFLAAR